MPRILVRLRFGLATALCAAICLAPQVAAASGKTPYLFTGAILLPANPLATTITLNLQYDDFALQIKPEWVKLGGGLASAKVSSLKRLDEQTLAITLGGKLDMTKKTATITLAPEAVASKTQLAVSLPLAQPVLRALPRNIAYAGGQASTWQVELVAGNFDFPATIKAKDIVLGGGMQKLKISKLTRQDQNHLQLTLTGKVQKQKTGFIQIKATGTGSSAAARVNLNISELP